MPTATGTGEAGAEHGGDGAEDGGGHLGAALGAAAPSASAALEWRNDHHADGPALSPLPNESACSFIHEKNETKPKMTAMPSTT